MKIHVDQDADALYLRLDDSKIIESEEVSPGVVLDYNEQKQVVGIEMLNLSLRTPHLNFRELQYQTAWRCPATLLTSFAEELCRVWLAEFGVPVESDSRIVPRAAYFVGIFTIVGLGREVDEENFIGGDCFEAVEYSWGNLDEDAVMFADDDAVGLSVGGAFGTGIVEADFGHSVNDGHAVGLFFVCVPGFDDAWVDGAEVGLAKANKVGVVFSEDLHDAAAIVAVLREG
jgi:uncharacterized protein YuzE